MSAIKSLNSHDVKIPRVKADNADSTQQYVEDVTILWFDPYMDEAENQKDVETTKTLLREINDYVLFFSKPDPCIDYINSVPKEKIFIITSGFYALEHLDKIHHLQQIDSVFIFCVFRAKYLPLKDKYSKIIDVFTEQKDLMDSLRNNIELVTKQAAAFGLFDGKERSTKFLTRESASFLWFQLLTDVLKNIALSDIKNTGIEEMLQHCHCYYRGNRVELHNIEEFRQQYKSEDAIVWYSKQSFVYRLVNKALRTEDIDALYTFRVYITHLRSQIANEHGKLRRTHSNPKSNIIHLYRGLKMTNAEISQMVDNVGGIVSMNGFFSTSRLMEQAVRFATKPSQRKEVVGVLLEIDGDVNLDKMIFADIAQYSAYPKEQEVLFDLATIFKIVHVEFDKVKKLWVMQLSGTISFSHLQDRMIIKNVHGVGKASYSVNDYIKGVEKETEESNSTLLLSRLMCDMSEYGKSEKYLKRLLADLPSDHSDISKIYFHLGRVGFFRGEYNQALNYYDHAIDLQKREVAPKDKSFDIARTLHNIANIYLQLKQIPKALEYYEKALEMKRAILTDKADHPSIATTLSAIATVYRKRGELDKSLELYKQSYEIKKLSLAVDHPSIADSLNGLGTIYYLMEDYEQALDCFQKALDIQRKNLPPKHPSIGDTLNNLGSIYRIKEDYNRAIVCYSQALEIEQITLSPDHIDLTYTYGNLSLVYFENSDYDKALEMARCKLNILKKCLEEDDEQIQSAKNYIDDIIKEINQPTSIQKESPYSHEAYF